MPNTHDDLYPGGSTMGQETLFDVSVCRSHIYVEMIVINNNYHLFCLINEYFTTNIILWYGMLFLLNHPRVDFHT